MKPARIMAATNTVLATSAFVQPTGIDGAMTGGSGDARHGSGATMGGYAPVAPGPGNVQG